VFKGAHPWVKASFAQCGGFILPSLNDMGTNVESFDRRKIYFDVQLVWIFQKFAFVKMRKMKKTLSEEGNTFLKFLNIYFWILPKLSILALEKEHILQ
jgi:hypothetical protein